MMKNVTMKKADSLIARCRPQVILNILKEQPSLSIREMAVHAGMSVHSVQHHINKLKESELMSNKKKYFKINIANLNWKSFSALLR